MATFLSIREFKKVFDPILESELEKCIMQASSLTDDTFILELLGYPKVLLAAGGKRVRPYVADLMYRSAGGLDGDTVKALTGLEVFHLFGLMHDDIIDEGKSRHGVPTLHAHVRQQRAPGGSDNRRQGGAQALLVGDLVFGWAQELLFRNTPSTRMPEVQDAFNEMVRAVVVGQMIDVKLMDRQRSTMDEVVRKSELKTAHYTFIHPMRIGAALAGQRDAHERFCRDFGRALGIAFQIQDDMLDIIGDPIKTGKDHCSDVVEGQHTVLTQYIFDHGSDAQRDALGRVFRNPEAAQEASAVQKLFASSGALDYGHAQVAEYIRAARLALRESSIEPDAQEAWETLIQQVEGRSA
jgi:geranylgeranyl diphosphate synthase, type I